MADLLSPLPDREIRWEDGRTEKISNAAAHREVFGVQEPEVPDEAELERRRAWRRLAAKCGRWA